MERPAPLAKLASDEFLPVNRRYFVEKHLRTSLMKRPLGRKHFLHQSGLRSGEDIAHLSLLLNLVAQDIFNRAPVEFGNLLKFIKADYTSAVTAMLNFIESAQSPILAKVDNDAMMPPGWLLQCLQVLDRHPERMGTI